MRTWVLVWVGLPVALAAQPAASLNDHVSWLAGAPVGQPHCVAFRWLVERKVAPARAELAIFADARYLLWVNGRLTERGPGRQQVNAPRYDEVDIGHLLHRGANQLALLVQARAAHAPGLAVRLREFFGDGRVVDSFGDEYWRASGHTRYLPPLELPAWPAERVDARDDHDDWTGVFYDDHEWPAAVPVAGRLWGPLLPRYLPRLREVVLEPEFLRERAGARAWAACLPLTLTPARPALVDVGQLVLGHEQFDFTAEAGVVFEVQPVCATTAFAAPTPPPARRYTAWAGRQSWVTASTAGYRYLRLSVAGGALTLTGLRVFDRHYPFDVVGSFQCSDARLTELWQRSVATLAACSEDGYSDSLAGRTQSVTEAVLRAWPLTQAALAVSDGDEAQTVRWGDPRLLLQALRQSAAGQALDGALATEPSPTAPAAWVRGLRALYEATGERGLVLELWPALRRQMAWFAEHPAAADDAARVAAWRDAALLALVADDDEALATWPGVAAAAAAAFTPSLAAPTPESACAALTWDAVPADRGETLARWLSTRVDELSTPDAVAAALAPLTRAGCTQAALDAVRRRWAGTFGRPEHELLAADFTAGGGADLRGIGVAVWLTRCVLGVDVAQPLTERRVTLAPHLGDLTQASGRVATPWGLVAVDWRRGAAGLEFAVELPAAVRATLVVPGDARRVTLDGQTLEPARVRREGDRLRVELDGGSHRGRIDGG